MTNVTVSVWISKTRMASLTVMMGTVLRVLFGRDGGMGEGGVGFINLYVMTQLGNFVRKTFFACLWT